MSNGQQAITTTGNLPAAISKPNRDAPIGEQVRYLTNLFERSKNKLAQVAPKHITPERMIRILAGSLSRNPKLAQCDEGSLLIALMTATQLGLEPNTPLGHSSIVPIWNGKAQKQEAQFWPGYRGLVLLAEQSGHVKGIRSRLVRERDLFEYQDTHEGEKWTFVPAEGERGHVRKVFAVAERGKEMRPQIEIMTLDEVLAIRDASPTKGAFGPWADHPEEMTRKTAVKRLAKSLPMSVEPDDDVEDRDRPLSTPGRFARALHVDDLASGSIDIDSMIAGAATAAAELPSGPANVPAADPNAAKDAPAPKASEPAKEPPKTKRAAAAREKVAETRGNAAPPPEEPVAPKEKPTEPAPAAPEPDPIPTSDAPPDNDDAPDPFESDDEPPPMPDDAPAEKTEEEKILEACAACSTTKDIRAWYDETMKAWDRYPKETRQKISAAYKAKKEEIASPAKK